MHPYIRTNALYCGGISIGVKQDSGGSHVPRLPLQGGMSNSPEAQQAFETVMNQAFGILCHNHDRRICIKLSASNHGWAN